MTYSLAPCKKKNDCKGCVSRHYYFSIWFYPAIYDGDHNPLAEDTTLRNIRLTRYIAPTNGQLRMAPFILEIPNRLCMSRCVADSGLAQVPRLQPNRYVIASSCGSGLIGASNGVKTAIEMIG